VWSSLTRLSAGEIRALLPKASDRTDLIAPIEVVEADADENEKKDGTVSRIDEIAGTVLEVAGHFAPGLGA
jgi:hypothetical protein